VIRPAARRHAIGRAAGQESQGALSTWGHPPLTSGATKRPILTTTCSGVVFDTLDRVK